MEFILACPKKKRHNVIPSNAQNCTTKYTTCCTKKFIEKLTFLYILVSLNRQKIKFTSTNLVNTNRFIKGAT